MNGHECNIFVVSLSILIMQKSWNKHVKSSIGPTSWLVDNNALTVKEKNENKIHGNCGI